MALDNLAVIESPSPVAGSAAAVVDDYSDHLASLVAYFEEAEDQTREARKLSERDIDYIHNDQWTSEELAILKKRKQPALTINYIKRKVETMRGLERRMRSDPKAFPRTPQEEQGAEAATDALRFVADQTEANEIRSLIYEDMIGPGTGGAEAVVEELPNGDYKIVWNHVPWSRLGWDPHSIKADFDDAKYKFIVVWMDKADALAKYGDRKEAIEGTLSYGRGDVYQDTPRDSLWCDSKRTRLRVVNMHYRRGGEWMVATFTKGGFFVDPVVSPYVDKDGKSTSNLFMRSLYIDRNGNRYGAVRDFISLQDEINKRRSKLLHLSNVRQTFANRKATRDVQAFRQSAAQPDGHFDVDGDAAFGQDFGIVPTSDLSQGQVHLLQQATEEMQATGANSALAGTDPRGQSGRAQQLQQQAGQLTLEPGIDGLRIITRQLYEATWLLVRQFWTAEKWVRVTDDERNIKWVGLNKPVTLGEKIQKLPPDRQQQALQDEGIQSPHDPRLQTVVDIENSVSGLDVDIVIEEGPDLASLQSEQFEMLSGLAKAGMPIPPKAIIQASSLRNKDVILDEMENGGAPSPQIQAQMAQMQKQIQQLSGALENAAKEHEQAEQELADKGSDFQIQAYKAETDRLKLTAPAMSPEQIQLLVMQTVQEALHGALNPPQGVTPPPVSPSGPQQLPPDGSFIQGEQPAYQGPAMDPEPPPGFPGVEPPPGLSGVLEVAP
jgi:hypothetical protein